MQWLFLIFIGAIDARLRDPNVFVGQLLQYEVSKVFSSSPVSISDASGDPLPRWIVWDGQVLSGIPQIADLGSTYLRVTAPENDEDVVEVHVNEEVTPLSLHSIPLSHLSR